MSDSDEIDPDLTYRSRPATKAAERDLTSRMRGELTTPSQLSGTPISMGRQDRGLKLGRVLGRGGQAEILAATQRSLRREVAVKQLLSDEDDSEALIREAYVTGALEHPNIVPVHDLVFDARGLPQLVLKRIEGRSWIDFIREPNLVAELHEDDSLEWHIRVAIQLTRALSFAHERGIIHRDIKPSNVMIGSFGEVYLLDWGLAASVNEDEEFFARVPPGEIAGTQAYMAPEQMVGLGADLGAATDVYLLAASLWHAVCGEPPWRTLGEGREANAPSATIPKELERILEGALQPALEERTSSADILRRHLEGFLRQRGSHQLADRALRRAQVAEEARKTGELEAAEYSATEAAILYRAALEEWPENESAREGEEALLRARVGHALARRLPAVAGQLLATMTHAPPDLVALVEDETQKAAEETSRLAALSHESDKGVEVDFRRYVVLFGGSVWVSLWVVGAMTQSVLFAMGGLTAAALVAFVGAFATRHRWTRTHHNRATVGSWLVVSASACTLSSLALVQGADYESLSAWLLVLFATASSFGAVAIDMRAGLFAGVWVSIVLSSLAWPPASPWLLVAGSVAMVGIGVWVNLQNRRVGSLRR